MIKNIAKNISHSQKLLGILTTSHLVNDFYGVLLPFLIPTLIAEYNLSYFQAGFLSLATSLFSGLLQPIIGKLADIYQKRKLIIMLGFFAFSLGLTIAGFSQSYNWLLVAFFIFGLGTATFHGQSTNLITTAFPNARGKSMGFHGIGGSIGNFSAPLLATFVFSTFYWRQALGLLIIPAIVIIFFLWRMLSEQTNSKKIVEKTPFLTPQLILFSFNSALIFMAYSGFLTFLPTFLVSKGYSLTQAGAISSFMFFLGLFAQPIGGYIYDKMGGRFIIGGASLLLAISLFFITIETNLPIIVYIAIIGVSVLSTFPVTLAMGSAIAKPNTVGASVGFIFGVAGVMSSFTPALTGYVADRFGLQQSFRILVVLAFLSFVVSFFLPKRKIEPQN